LKIMHDDSLPFRRKPSCRKLSSYVKKKKSLSRSIERPRRIRETLEIRKKDMSKNERERGKKGTKRSWEFGGKRDRCPQRGDDEEPEEKRRALPSTGKGRTR